jgi:DNA-binding IclR family transcriptional regulator
MERSFLAWSSGDGRSTLPPFCIWLRTGGNTERLTVHHAMAAHPNFALWYRILQFDSCRRAMNQPESKNSIQVIERMVRLLDALAASPAPASLKQLAQSAGLHPSTAHRILAAMISDRMVERVEQGSYRLGMRLIELGNLAKSRVSVREHALPFMRELHAATGEAVNLSVRRGDEIVYIERSSSGRAMMRVVNVIGGRAPLHITAVGKLFLLEEGAEGVREYARRTKLPGHTRNSLTSPAALEKELDKVRRQGYAVDHEEAELGVRCIAAGIRDDDGALVAGLSVSAPAERMQASWSQLVRETAEKISRSIGYSG